MFKQFCHGVRVNKKMGWVCIGTPGTHNKNMVEFAPGCVATMNGQELIALWLHPTNLPDGI